MIATPPQTRYRWVICALIFLATTINYMDRQILSLLKPMLDEQLRWTNEQFGAVNSAFQGAYAVSVFFFGWLIDRYGTKIGYTASIAAWSVAAIGHALVNSFGGFFGARIALGLGEGGNFPAAIKSVAQWFPQKERALATSLLNSGANVGAIIAPALVPPVAAAFGWHWTFILVGVAGFFWIALWLPLFDPPEVSRRVSASELSYIESDAPDPSESHAKVSYGAVLRHREAWSYITAKFFTDPVWYFYLIWLPDFFKKTRHLDIKNSWVLLVSIYSIITVLSIAGGWLTGFLVSRGWSITRARKTGMLLFALAALPMLLATRVDNWTVVLLIGLAGAGHQAWSATIFTTVSDMLPKRAVATLIGAGTTAGAITGMISPYVTGKLLDRFANGYELIFWYCALAYLVAFGINHLLAPRFERIVLEEPA